MLPAPHATSRTVSSYAETAHHLTSQSSRRCPFHPGRLYPRPQRHDHRSSLAYLRHGSAQTASWTQSAVMQVAGGQSVSLTQPIDIVVGAGRKAQTYLYWQGNQLFELPVSYWTGSRQWTNSPGYEDGTMEFGKAIVPRCLECHATRFDPVSRPQSTASGATPSSSASPARSATAPPPEHVALYRSPTPPAHGMPTGLVDLHTLPRERQIDGFAPSATPARSSPSHPPSPIFPATTSAASSRSPTPAPPSPSTSTATRSSSSAAANASAKAP